MKALLNVNDVAKMCEVKQGKAYEIMREINKEMKEKGFLIIRGRVNSSYLMERLGIKDIKFVSESYGSI